MTSATADSSPETPVAASRRPSRESSLSGMEPTLPVAATSVPGVPIALPEPYDFHRSTFRFRTFGRDAASVWENDALYRVLRSGVVVRVSADGVATDRTVDARDEAEVRHILGASFDLEAFAHAQPEIAARAAGATSSTASRCGASPARRMWPAPTSKGSACRGRRCGRSPRWPRPTST